MPTTFSTLCRPSSPITGPGPICASCAAGARSALDDTGYVFELGKAQAPARRRHVLLISTGLMTMRAHEAAEALERDRIEAAILDAATLKPLDEAAIRAAAARSGRPVFVMENHSVVGGLGRGEPPARSTPADIPSGGLPPDLPDAFPDACAPP